MDLRDYANAEQDLSNPSTCENFAFRREVIESLEKSMEEHAHIWYALANGDSE